MNIGSSETIGTFDSSPIRPAPPAPLEHHHEHAVGGAGAEQVQERSLQWHDDRPKDQRQEQERQGDDRGDEEREPILHAVADVDEARRAPADVSGGLAVPEDRGQDVLTESSQRRGRRVVLRAARREDDERGDPGVQLGGRYRGDAGIGGDGVAQRTDARNRVEITMWAYETGRIQS